MPYFTVIRFTVKALGEPIEFNALPQKMPTGLSPAQ